MTHAANVPSPAGGIGPPVGSAVLDGPFGPELLEAVARLLRDTLRPLLPPDAAFQARVAANALELARREWLQAPAAAAAAQARLQALLGHDGPPAALEAELCRRIADGSLPGDDPGLQAHLWAGTLERLAIDQPAYAPYRDEIGADRHDKE
jgi:AcrR family transcriptional regulator